MKILSRAAAALIGSVLLPIADLRRSHARVFREALQSVPKIRRGNLLKASLPELSEYGRSSGKSVSRRYGAKAMIDRWGAKTLKQAIDNINYPGLDLSRVRTIGIIERIRGTTNPRRMDLTK